MYSKLILNFLLAFLASNPHRIIFAQDDAENKLEELIKNPGWSLMENEKIVDNGKEVTMLELLNAFDGDITSEISNEHLIRHLAIMLSCKQSKFIKEYVISFLSTLNLCKQRKDLPGDNYFNCVTSLLKNIQNIDFTVTRMLNILTYFYQLSPVTTDFKQLYNALMTLKLYSENESKNPTQLTSTHNQNMPNSEERPDKIKIGVKCQEIENFFFSINLQVQAFAVMYCLPTTQPLRHSDINDQYINHIRILIKKEKETFELYSEPMTNLVNKFNEECFVALGFEHLDVCYVDAINMDLQHISVLLEQRNLKHNKVRIPYFRMQKEVTDVVQEVTSQYSTKKLAAFQKSSLKSIAQMFYKKLIDLLLILQTKFSEIKNNINAELCPPDFFTVLVNDWEDLKNELMKFLSVDWPTEIAETLKTLIFYLEMKHIEDPRGVVNLLELDMNVASAVFVHDNKTLRGNDYIICLEILRTFTDDVVMLRKSINNVRLNNALLLNDSDFEETKLIKPTNEFDGKALQKTCNMSTKLIELFNLLKNNLNYFIEMDKEFDKYILTRLSSISVKLNERLLSIVHFLLLQMLEVPKAENVNLRNAVVLMLMFDTKLINATDENVNEVIRKVIQLEKLALLILNQIEYYVEKNCDFCDYYAWIVKINDAFPFQYLLMSPYAMIDDTKNIIGEMKNIPLIDKKCYINISLGYYDTLVNGEKDDFNPLKCIVELKFQWDGTLQSIQYIQKEVESSISPKKFAMYQNLVQNSVASIFLGYILNILQTAGQDKVNFTDKQIASILLKIKQFDSIVYPTSKVDSPSHILNVFVWCFEQNKISHTKATILKDKIERKIESYDINMTDYYNVLKSNNILNEYASDDVQKTYIAPLEEFVDHWVEMFKLDFYCVGNYMKLIL